MSTVTKIRVVYRDMPGELSYEATVQAAILCEVCADEGVPGVTETTTGLSVCHPCFYGQIAEGMVAVVAAITPDEECRADGCDSDSIPMSEFCLAHDPESAHRL